MANKYSIEFTKNVEKFIRRQDTITQKRNIDAVLALPEGDVKKYKRLFSVF